MSNLVTRNCKRWGDADAVWGEEEPIGEEALAGVNIRFFHVATFTFVPRYKELK